MRLYSDLLLCPQDQFPQRIAQLERLSQRWKYDLPVVNARSSSEEADSDDVMTFARDPLRNIPGYCRRLCLIGHGA